MQKAIRKQPNSKTIIALTVSPSDTANAEDTVRVFRTIFHTASLLLNLSVVESCLTIDGGWRYCFVSSRSVDEDKATQIVEMMRRCHRPAMEACFPHLIGQKLCCTINVEEQEETENCR